MILVQLQEGIAAATAPSLVPVFLPPLVEEEHIGGLTTISQPSFFTERSDEQIGKPVV